MERTTLFQIGSWLLRGATAIILLQTLYFKFTGAPESVYIFSTLGLEPWGRIGTGVMELIASVLLLLPQTVAWGALLSLGIISGAIFSHLTKLGIALTLVGDHGELFALAVVVFVCSAAVLILHRQELPRLPWAMAALLLVVPVMTPAPVQAKDSVAATYTHRGLAVSGYDPVAYFEAGMPVKGAPANTFDHMGAKYQFATAANRDKFAAMPEKYAPQYGGYCAYAVSQGHTASADPEAWTIVNGKLYLNYSKGVQKKWEKDAAAYIQAAEKNWPALHK